MLQNYRIELIKENSKICQEFKNLIKFYITKYQNTLFIFKLLNKCQNYKNL
jgi:hypothetical protein